MNAPNYVSSYFDFLQTAKYYRDLDKQTITPDTNRFLQHCGQFLQAGLPMFYVLDFTQKRYISMSKSIENALGYSAAYVMDAGLELIINRYHPDDRRAYFGDIFMKNVNFLRSRPAEDHSNYIFGYNYRFKAKNGEYHTLLQRHNMIQSATDGTPLAMLSFLTDISGYKTDSKIIHTIDRIDGHRIESVQKNFIYPEEGANRLSKREMELLKWLCDGLSSKQIADKLCVSIHTVHNHRKNMLQKTNCKNAAELLHHAMQKGWF